MNRKGFFQIILLVIILIMIIGIGAYFVISKKLTSKNPETSSTGTQTTATPQTNSETEATRVENNSPTSVNPLEKPIPSSLISLTEYGHGTFLIPNSIQRRTEIILKWTSDQYTLGWGNIATICLIGLDGRKQPVKLKENKDLCYPDLQLLLATTSLSLGEYKWLSSDYENKFISSPTSYQLSVRVLDSLPPEGRSEWAGLISESTSNEFTFK